MNDNSKGVRFEKIIPTPAQSDALYESLNARTHTISHSAMPDRERHDAFVKNHPYRAWYLVLLDGGCVGTVYVTNDNTVGLNLTPDSLPQCVSASLTFILENFEPLAPIPSVRAGHFCINVAPDNHALAEELKKRGSRVLQVTYSV